MMELLEICLKSSFAMELIIHQPVLLNFYSHYLMNSKVIILILPYFSVAIVDSQSQNFTNSVRKMECGRGFD